MESFLPSGRGVAGNNHMRFYIRKAALADCTLAIHTWLDLTEHIEDQRLINIAYFMHTANQKAGNIDRRTGNSK